MELLRTSDVTRPSPEISRTGKSLDRAAARRAGFCESGSQRPKTRQYSAKNGFDGLRCMETINVF